MQDPRFFWFSVALVYFGIIILLLDVLIEKLHPVFKGVFVLLLIAFSTVFSLGVVFVRTPLGIGAIFNSSHLHELGDEVAGIKWQDSYSELMIIIGNQSPDRYYDDLEIRLRPDCLVAQIGCMEHSGNSEVSFELASDIRVQGSRFQILATDVGYKIHCSRLPPGGHVAIVTALVNVDQFDELKQLRNPNAIAYDVRDVVNGDYRVAFGSPSEINIYSTRPTKSPSILIDGSFTGAQRRHKIYQRITATNPMPQP
jgi:hypothetical protein